MQLGLGQAVLEAELRVDGHVLGGQQVLDWVGERAETVLVLLAVHHLQQQ